MTCVLFREESGLASPPTKAQLSHHHPLISPPSADLRGARTVCRPRLRGSLSPWTSPSLVHLPLLGPKLDSSVTMAVSSVPLSRRAHLIVASPKFLEMNCPGPWAPNELNEIHRGKRILLVISFPSLPTPSGGAHLRDCLKLARCPPGCRPVAHTCASSIRQLPLHQITPVFTAPSTGDLPRGLFQGTRSLASGQNCFERSRRPTTGLTRTLPTPPRPGAQPHRPRPRPHSHAHLHPRPPLRPPVKTLCPLWPFLPPPPWPQGSSDCRRLRPGLPGTPVGALPGGGGLAGPVAVQGTAFTPLLLCLLLGLAPPTPAAQPFLQPS